MPLLSRRSSALNLAKSRAAQNDAVSERSDIADHDHLKPAVVKPPARPASDHEYRSPPRLSHDVPPSEAHSSSAFEAPKPKRFSLMKLRNLSEPQLSYRARMDAARQDEEERPPVPSVMAGNAVPSIVKTAPTTDMSVQQREQPAVEEERVGRPSFFKRTSSRRGKSEHRDARVSTESRNSSKKTSSMRWRMGRSNGLEDLRRLSTMHVAANNQQSSLPSPHPPPPSYGDESNSTLAVPVSQLPDSRISESSQSDGTYRSSNEGHIYGATTTTHTISTQTTFFKLPRRNKNRNSLFPLPVKIPPPNTTHRPEPDPEQYYQAPATPRASNSEQSAPSDVAASQNSSATTSRSESLRRRNTLSSSTEHRGRESPATTSSPYAAPTKSSLSFAEPSMHLFRGNSQQSQSSDTSSPLQPPMRFGLRDRASTTSSSGRKSDVETPPPNSASGRNSLSTTGRTSLGTLLTLSRFRQGPESLSPRHGSPGSRSKSNSFAMSREALVVPEREDGDTPGKYLERLEAAVSRSVIAGILSKSGDPFAQAVLRSYTRRFPFFGEPIDMSLRKFLLEAELPKETQQVDRVIQAFADRYHECNPGIFNAPDQAYVIAFSIMMLHTDAFNKNNKRKMQKHDYIKNTSGQGLSDEILSCFYDNICYTPFVHYEEEVDINGERVLPFKSQKSSGKLKSAIPGAEGVGSKKPSGPVDPYNLLVDQQLDQLRPSIKESITMGDPYNYLGSQGELDIHYLQRAFTHTGVLQIISARSRPAAYENQVGNGEHHSTETQQGIVDLKITKVGTLWRKSTKKKKTRSPWQEWGAILTGSQLYLFQNAHWAKGLMHQFTNHQKHGQLRTPVVFKPPLQDFKPDAHIKTDNAVALVDATYTRHKHAFIFVRTGGQEEILLADNEHELCDWLGLINYAAAFRAAGVRIRGMVGGAEEDQRSKEVKRSDSNPSAQTDLAVMGDATAQNRGLSPQLQRQVMAARRQIMVQKIGEIEKEMTNLNRQLDGMLRNARHLLVLAPITQKSREDVIHAAARADALVKWLRRDIWRMRCHCDILVMDVKLDSLGADVPEKLVQERSLLSAEPESTSKKDKPKMLSRFSSNKGIKNQPHSPPTATATGRPSTTGSADTFLGGDVFRTPPETVLQQEGESSWLPPLNLNASHDQHRPSISATLLSASPPGTHYSLSKISSRTSGVSPARPSTSTDTSSRFNYASSFEDKEAEWMARTSISPERSLPVSRDFNLDGTTPTGTPDGKHKGYRRSLHKTLREAHHHHHHHPSATHKHRRGKDSDSTLRSGGFEEKEREEGTPGLAREKPRFILHGKQASVVRFSGDWERMKLRREQLGQENVHSGGGPSAADQDRNADQSYRLRNGLASSSTPRWKGGVAYEDEEETASVLSARLRSFREDAQAAAAFAGENLSSPRHSPSPNPSPLRNSSVSASSESEPPVPAMGVRNGASASYYDPLWDGDTDDDEGSMTGKTNKRQTVIGPNSSSSAAIYATSSATPDRPKGLDQWAADGTVRLVETEDDDEEENDEGENADDDDNDNDDDSDDDSSDDYYDTAEDEGAGPSSSRSPTSNGDGRESSSRGTIIGPSTT